MKANVIQLLKLLEDPKGLSVYKTRDGETIIRRKWGADAERMKTDPAYLRARQHGLEFGRCAREGAAIRYALGDFIYDVQDKHISGRMNKLMNALKKLDKAIPGKRSPVKGLMCPQADAIARGFNFNESSPLDKILRASISVDRETRAINFPKITRRDMRLTRGATHAVVSACFLHYNPRQKKWKPEVISTPAIDAREGKTEFSIRSKQAFVRGGICIMVIKAIAVQLINGKAYEMRHADAVGAAVVGVACE